MRQSAEAGAQTAVNAERRSGVSGHASDSRPHLRLNLSSAHRWIAESQGELELAASIVLPVLALRLIPVQHSASPRGPLATSCVSTAPGIARNPNTARKNWSWKRLNVAQRLRRSHEEVFQTCPRRGVSLKCPGETFYAFACQRA